MHAVRLAASWSGRSGVVPASQGVVYAVTVMRTPARDDAAPSYSGKSAPANAEEASGAYGSNHAK